MKENTLKKVKKDFTQVSNKILYDKNLSLDERALGAILESFPDDWKFYNSYICEKCSIGKDKLNRMYANLEKNGYLKRERKRDHNGKFAGFEFIIDTKGGLNTPQTQKPTTVIIPVSQKTETDKAGAGSAGAGICEPTNTNYNNTNLTNTLSNAEREISKIKEDEDKYISFDKFKKLCIKNKNKISFQLPYPFHNLQKGTVVEINEIGYLLNATINKMFDKDKSLHIWSYMYQKQEKIIDMIKA